MPTSQPTGRDQTADRLQSDSAALISAKDETITTLRDQLEAERQAHAEARRIIAGLVERIPAIAAPAETPPDEPGSPETGEEQQGRGTPRPDAPGPQEDVQRPWWRRVFGQR
jgi:hypothetical protein